MAKTLIDDLKAKDFCSNCGRRTEVICKGRSIWTGKDCGISLCSTCAKKCKKCKKYYCLKHIDNHNCIK
ncbi:MAG: hypothetical protein WC781_00315 [Candidatus Pacearchaeota archaeon]|jgi:hypothetical protein